MRQAGQVAAPSGYLDALGGQPLLPVAAAAMAAALESAYADPVRLHHQGRQAGLILDTIRASLAESLTSICAEPVHPDEVYLTSSLASAASYAISGIMGTTSNLGAGQDVRPVLVSAVEARIVLELVQAYPHHVIPVDEMARVSVARARQALAAGSSLLCLQVANSEVGTRQPIAEVAGLAQAAGTPLLMDATGAIGHGPVPSGWSLMMAAGRDWAGPAGVALLVVRRHTRWVPPPGSERGWLGGFPDIPAAAGAAAALEVVLRTAQQENQRTWDLVAEIRSQVARLADVVVVGDPQDRLPHVVTFSVLYAHGEALVSELDRRGFSVASGSACVADDQEPSHVLAAMGAYTGGNIRVSLPLGCTNASVDAFLAALPAAIAAVREPL